MSSSKVLAAARKALAKAEAEKEAYDKERSRLWDQLNAWDQKYGEIMMPFHEARNKVVDEERKANPLFSEIVAYTKQYPNYQAPLSLVHEGKKYPTKIVRFCPDNDDDDMSVGDMHVDFDAAKVPTQSLAGRLYWSKRTRKFTNAMGDVEAVFPIKKRRKVS